MSPDSSIIDFSTELLSVFLFGLGILVFFRVVTLLSKYFLAENQFRRIILKAILFLEFFVWIALLFWGVDRLLTAPVFDKPLIIIITSFAILIVLWYWGRDVFAGVLLRMENSFNVREFIQTELGSGFILKFGIRTLKLESSSGKIFYLPYTKISSEKLLVEDNSKRVKFVELNMAFPKTLQPEHIKNTIFTVLNHSVLASPFHKNGVTFIGEEHSSYNFKISTYLLHEDHFQHIIDDIRKQLNI